MANMILCPECPKTFKTGSGLVWHLEYIHGRSEEDAVTDNPFQCPLCNSKAESGPVVVRHVVWEHDKRMSDAMSLCGVEFQEIIDEASIEWLGKGRT
ncbi:hypothetical protein ACFLTP_05860 [Chloroflexota bacterium]